MCRTGLVVPSGCCSVDGWLYILAGGVQVEQQDLCVLCGWGSCLPAAKSLYGSRVPQSFCQVLGPFEHQALLGGVVLAVNNAGPSSLQSLPQHTPLRRDCRWERKRQELGEGAGSPEHEVCTPFASAFSCSFQ